MPADAHLAALACAALHPGLRSVLVFDLPPWAFSRVAEQFATLIEARQGQTPHWVHLGLADHRPSLMLMPDSRVGCVSDSVTHHFK